MCHLFIGQTPFPGGSQKTTLKSESRVQSPFGKHRVFSFQLRTSLLPPTRPPSNMKGDQEKRGFEIFVSKPPPPASFVDGTEPMSLRASLWVSHEARGTSFPMKKTQRDKTMRNTHNNQV